MKLDSDHQYDDIIDQPHHVSHKRIQMPRQNRAAQFAPFAALTGFEDEVKETARLTEQEVELDEEQKALINDQLRTIVEAGKAQSEVTITYFEPDQKKNGGAYMSVTGKVRRIDAAAKTVILADRTVIPMEKIAAIDEKTDR